MARHDRPCRNFGEFGDHECVYRCDTVNLNTSLNASTNVSANASISGRASGLGKILSVGACSFFERSCYFSKFYTSRVIPRRDPGSFDNRGTSRADQLKLSILISSKIMDKQNLSSFVTDRLC